MVALVVVIVGSMDTTKAVCRVTGDINRGLPWGGGRGSGSIRRG